MLQFLSFFPLIICQAPSLLACVTPQSNGPFPFVGLISAHPKMQRGHSHHFRQQRLFAGPGGINVASKYPILILFHVFVLHNFYHPMLLGYWPPYCPQRHCHFYYHRHHHHYPHHHPHHHHHYPRPAGDDTFIVIRRW